MNLDNEADDEGPPELVETGGKHKLSDDWEIPSQVTRKVPITIVTGAISPCIDALSWQHLILVMKAT